MPPTTPTFEQKRTALCYCCGGWQHASQKDIETRWNQLPAKRAESYLHRVEKLRSGNKDEKAQYDAFVKSLPAIDQAAPAAKPKPAATPAETAAQLPGAEKGGSQS